jgi:rhamnogalacturonyl hydrolase YesR
MLNCFKTSFIKIMATIAPLAASIALASPQEVGNRIANNIISRDLSDAYACACSFYGVCIFSEATNNPQLLSAVIDKYQPYVTGQKTPRNPGHVDWNVFGILPFELYRQTGNYDDYVPLAKFYADTEFENPRPDGLSPYTRFWVDDMYMVGSLQAQAYKNLQDPKYINNGVTQLLGYIEEVEDLQRPNGLFHHAYNSPFFWGRGNGWAAAAMTETLLAMPFDHPKRGQLMDAYQRMMDGLLEYQDESGMWYQLVNLTENPGNWFETSSTGMFVFALATGVQHGWLVGDHYKNAAIGGWTALEGYVNNNGQVEEVCVGTGRGNSVQYYLDRPRRLGDFHGQAGVIWAATAMVRSGLMIDRDFNHDGSVDMIDFSMFAQHWGLSNRIGPIQEPRQPVGHWQLDETNGTIAHDSSPNANHGRVSGADWDAQGKFNAAARFDSEYDRIEIPITAMSVSRGTISLWCRLNPGPQPTRHLYLFGHATAPYYSNRIQLYMNDGDRSLDLGLGNSHTTSTAIKTLQTQTWYHIALTRDGSNYLVFVDGIPQASGTYSGLRWLNSAADIGNNGRLDDSQRNEAFNGLLDDVRLYNYVLSGPEIAYLATSDGSYIPFPQDAIKFDLCRDDKIDLKDLKVFLENWLAGK